MINNIETRDMGKVHGCGHKNTRKRTCGQWQMDRRTRAMEHGQGDALESYGKSISAGALDSRLCVDFSFHQIDEYLKKKLQSRMPYK